MSVITQSEYAAQLRRTGQFEAADLERSRKRPSLSEVSEEHQRSENTLTVVQDGGRKTIVSVSKPAAKKHAKKPAPAAAIGPK